MTASTPHNLASLTEAIACLKVGNVSQVDLDTIMQFHVLEDPELKVVEKNYSHGYWSNVSGQLMALANTRQRQLVGLVTGGADPEALLRHARMIELLEALSVAIWAINRPRAA